MFSASGFLRIKVQSLLDPVNAFEVKPESFIYRDTRDNCG
jgi:hypothetical protein